MHRTIIAVRGQPNSGKSTAIALAYDELSEEGDSVYTNPRPDATELKEILLIDGVLVGFISAGDMPDRLKRSLLFMLRKGCDVILCAARLNIRAEPSHRTIDIVETFARENAFRVRWIEKPRRPGSQETANRAVAEEMVRMTRRAIARAEPANV